MTTRLEQAIRQLPPEKVEEVTKFAESLAQHGQAQSPRFLSLDWAGRAADAYPEHQSGVEAEDAAMQMMIESMDRASKK